MSQKKKGLSPETIKKLQGIKRDKSESSQRFSELNLKPFCNLAEIKKEKPPITKPIKVAPKVTKKPKESSPKPVNKSTQTDNEELAIQHQQRTYKAGWNHERAEEARQRIKTTKPWLYSTGARTNLGKLIVRRNSFKHGLYAKVLNSSNLQSVEFSVTPADIQLKEEINYTSIEENEDISKG